MPTPLRLIRDGFPEDPGLDTALSRALLLRASSGDATETFRLNIPGRVVAFGKRDTISSRYPDAVAAARGGGYEAIERLAGGRAAVFHEGTLAFSWSIPDTDPRTGITSRFEALSGLMQRAFSRLGVDADVGEVPGEYCPGRYSVHAGGRLKLMGVGQRLARTAAHVGGVVMVTGSQAARDILVPVYAALGLQWNPGTVGALEDLIPGVTLEDAADAILAELAETHEPTTTHFDPPTLELARELAPGHIAPRA